ncbi:SdrD B-like domain-containing protein [Microbacterium sp. GCS4]|uniref:SdrD B-like domain-containing protein n=1 Tax=Microbacterium sp. GCS4 TaxID=1692239 RepID=UPI0006822B18|nr:SdrD B-like domain-containing protein [Microbacterium sp. GCS4]KNY05125.1 hypothetical protein AKH00_12070 [Microbacterium sp. GCS4]
MGVVWGVASTRGESVIRRVVAAAIVAIIVIAGLIGGAEAAHAVNGTVAGAVYQDFDDDGTRDPAAGDFGGDTGLAGVAVTVTDSTGAVVGTATTTANGSYSVNAVNAATAAVRVEFTLPNDFRSARIGAGNGSTVQFVNLGATNVNVGMTQDGMVMTERPPFVVVPNQRARITANTSPQPPTRPTPNFGSLPALFRVPYSTIGNPGSGRTTIALQRQIGTTWGTANYGTAFVLSGASFRRGTEVGPAGLGAIYLTDATSATPNATPFVQIPNPGVDPRGPINPANYDWFHDSAAFDAVGRIGLGDLEISSDQRTLYAVNLNDRQLYAVPMIPGANRGAAPTAGTPEAISIPLSAASGCAPENVHPHGLGTFRGALYVTLTCVGPTTSDLRAYVIPMDQSTRQFGAPVLNVPLNFSRPVYYSEDPPTTATSPYGSWRTTFQSSPTSPTARDTPTPLASSVTFDEAGNLALSIKDRTADQNGVAMGSLNPNDNAVYNYIGVGDLLRACVSASGEYVLENDGRCGAFTATQPINNWGPGGGKFYETVFARSNNTAYHGNTGLGSALQLPGYPNVLGTVINPVTFGSDGVRLFNNVNGRAIRSALLGGGPDEEGTGAFAKAGGLGDLSALVAVAPVEIGNRVWFDADGDGVQDAGERPIAGVTVRLFDANGIVVATAVTDAQGNYLFSSSAGTSSGSAIYGLGLLPDTEYEIRLDNANDYGPGGPLDNLIPTRTRAGSDPAVDSNGVVEGPTLITATVRTPGPGAADHTFDFGFAPELSLGNRLWFDTGAGAATNNGAFDAGEQPVVGAVVELLGADGAPVLDADGDPITTTTDASGFYRFDGLTPGDYIVQVAPSAFATDGPLHDFLSSTGSSPAFDGASNNFDKGVDAPFPAITGIRSGLIALAPGVTGEVDPGANGPGANGPFGDQFDNLTADFGFVPALSLGNRLWFDSGTGEGAANNGRFDAGEAPVVGAVVELLDGTGAAVLDADGDPITTTTDANGFYRFDGLATGDYTVRVAASNFAPGEALDGWFSSTPTSTNAQENNADKGVNAPTPAAAGIVSNVVTLSHLTAPLGDVDAGADGAGGHGRNGDAADLLTVDFGFTQAFAVGDFVWLDNDGDGQQDPGEPPVPGVLVTLLDEEGSPVVDLNGVPVAPVRTDDNGHYVFDNLPPGIYRVGFSDLPAQHRHTRHHEGDVTTDSDLEPDGMSPGFVLGPAGDNTTGVVPGDGVTVAQRIDRTIDAGIVPVLAVGDFVWIDANRDGRQDPGEVPVAGVTVELLDANGDPVLDANGDPVPATTTDAAGHYVFDNLFPGDYRIRFSGWPAGYVPTIQSAPGTSTAEDSNPDATGLTPVFSITGGGTNMRPVEAGDGTTRALQINPTIDLGIVAPLFAVGDYVWFDKDRDGVQDAGEKPVPGMTVTLFAADGTPALDWRGQPVPPVKTDGNGHYLFDGLPAGDYYVEFSGVPAGYRFTGQGPGGASDSNANTLGRTPVFTLGIGARDMRTVVAADGTILASFLNPTIDAGLVEIEKPLPPTGAVIPWILIVLSLVLVGGGATLLTLRRRRG